MGGRLAEVDAAAAAAASNMERALIGSTAA
jgi:hypothetical protein